MAQFDDAMFLRLVTLPASVFTSIQVEAAVMRDASE